MRLPLPFILLGLALSLGIGCGSVSSKSDGGGGTVGSGSGGSVGQGGGGGQAGGGAGGSCAACQSGAATACPAGVSAGALCSGTLQTCCAGDVELQCGCNTMNCTWSPICGNTGAGGMTGKGGTAGGHAGGSGGAGSGGVGAGGSGVGGGAGAGGVSGTCNSDGDCTWRTTGCCEETCMAVTDPVPAGTPICNIACRAPQATCGCVNHQCTEETGAGGQGGAGGGAAGSGGSGGASCTALESEYAAALPGAKSCAVGVTGQCQRLVSDSLAISPCHIGCDMIYVNDASALNAIESSWNQAGCNLDVACPNIACAAPTTGTCMAADGGGGICKSVTIATPTN